MSELSAETDVSLLKYHIDSFIQGLPDLAGESFLYELDNLHDSCTNAVGAEPDALLCSLFLNAIREHYRPRGKAGGHLYLEKYEIPQIKLFDILINKFPFVASAHAVCNSLISGWIGRSSSVAIIDIGIGRGMQMAALIRELGRNIGLQELTIIGIEPFGDAIGHARQVIGEATVQAPFRVELDIMEGFAEDINPSFLKKLLPTGCEKLIVNCSLAIHHIQTVKLRRQFFERLKLLNPHAILLTEPHSDHMTTDWRQRTRNAWVHYGAVFDTIDQLPVREQEKNGLKMFFGREISDVVGLPDRSRFERHQPADEWVTYGNEIGWRIDEDARPAIKIHASITLNSDERGLMMRRRSVDVLAVIPLVKSA